MNDHAYTLDDPTVAERFHSALLAQAARVHSGLQLTVRVVIVGAGSIGVELAGELRASAAVLARSLARQTRGRGSLPFRDHDRSTLISLGEDHAAGHLPSRDGG